MRTFIASALLIFTLSADAQILRPEPYDRDRNNRDPYYRDDRYSKDDPYYKDEPYYKSDRDGREGQRNRRQDDYRYGRQAPYGYGRDPLEVVNRIMFDVRMVANNYSFEKNDRKHFEEVEEELGKFTRKYREGNFDKNNLKDAAESLEHLALSNSITSSHDRRIIRYALNTVQDLRSGRYDVNTRSRTDDRRFDLENR